MDLVQGYSSDEGDEARLANCVNIALVRAVEEPLMSCSSCQYEHSRSVVVIRDVSLREVTERPGLLQAQLLVKRTD